MQRPADYYLIIILSIFLTRSALYHLYMSVTYLSHPCFYQKIVSVPQCSCQNICNCNHLLPFILHRSVCKGKACFMLTTWLCHQWVWPPFWLLSGYVFLWTSVCQNWSLDDKLQTGAGNWFPAPVFMSIYGVKYIIWQWCTLISLIVETPISV